MATTDDDNVIILSRRRHVPRGTWRIPWFGRGKSSLNEKSRLSPLRVQVVITSDGANSGRNCRHAPHGTIGVAVSATIAIVVKFLAPCSMALAAHTLSAQIVRLN